MLIVDRFLKEDDAKFRDLWDEHDPWSKENSRPDIAASNWRDIVSGGGPLFSFALRGETAGQPVGFILYRYNVSSKASQPECHICDIFVDKRFRRQGGAMQMMNAVIAEARKNKASRVRWIANPKRVESTAFYNNFSADKQEQLFYTMWLDNDG